MFTLFLSFSTIRSNRFSSDILSSPDWGLALVSNFSVRILLKWGQKKNVLEFGHFRRRAHKCLMMNSHSNLFWMLTNHTHTHGVVGQFTRLVVFLTTAVESVRPGSASHFTDLSVCCSSLLRTPATKTISFKVLSLHCFLFMSTWSVHSTLPANITLVLLFFISPLSALHLISVPWLFSFLLISDVQPWTSFRPMPWWHCHHNFVFGCWCDFWLSSLSCCDCCHRYHLNANRKASCRMMMERGWGRVARTTLAARPNLASHHFFSTHTFHSACERTSLASHSPAVDWWCETQGQDFVDPSIPFSFNRLFSISLWSNSFHLFLFKLDCLFKQVSSVSPSSSSPSSFCQSNLISIGNWPSLIDFPQLYSSACMLHLSTLNVDLQFLRFFFQKIVFQNIFKSRSFNISMAIVIPHQTHTHANGHPCSFKVLPLVVAFN